MLTLDLARLQRSGPQDLSGVIPRTTRCGTGWTGARCMVSGTTCAASMTSSGQVLVQGTVIGTLVFACRRCLDEVTVALQETVVGVWADPADLEEAGEAEDGEIRTLEPGSSRLDLEGFLREEILLRIPRWVECRKDCAGLCPRCGINRNEETCECSEKEADPRWDALRALSPDQRK
jgi:uncharacterized metal-binding protein YceD (DUF177 family)